jgi:hypothetical protein
MHIETNQEDNMATQKFTVAGRWPFPMDMLRYDRAFPADTESALKIGRAIEPPDNKTEFLIDLLTDQREVTVGRWRSFGWTVITRD